MPLFAKILFYVILVVYTLIFVYATIRYVIESIFVYEYEDEPITAGEFRQQYGADKDDLLEYELLIKNKILNPSVKFADWLKSRIPAEEFEIVK